MASPTRTPTVRIIPGELENRKAATRLVIPNSKQPEWPPFMRVGEVILNRLQTFPPHPHENEEVLTFVVEGLATYVVDSGKPESLRPGSARLLSAAATVQHLITPARSGPIHWFNMVVTAPTSTGTKPRLQGSEPPTAPKYDEDAHVRNLVGGGGPMASVAGLEVSEIAFVVPSTTFRRVGHGRRALVYALAGHGAVDERPVDSGEAALIEGVEGISVGGDTGFRVIVATAPA